MGMASDDVIALQWTTAIAAAARDRPSCSTPAGDSDTEEAKKNVQWGMESDDVIALQWPSTIVTAI